MKLSKLLRVECCVGDILWCIYLLLSHFFFFLVEWYIFYLHGRWHIILFSLSLASPLVLGSSHVFDPVLQKPIVIMVEVFLINEQILSLLLQDSTLALVRRSGTSIISCRTSKFSKIGYIKEWLQVWQVIIDFIWPERKNA